MNSIVWTGQRFLYVENTENTIWSAPPSGMPLQLFASMPKLVEETRCVQSSGGHGYPAGAIFCNSPDNKIYEISADGAQQSVLATLPVPASSVSDGMLAFDTVGHFGYQLVAATGRSGAVTPAGGTVYTVGPSGAVKEVGGYPGPGGADELIVAPASFGSAAGEALLTVDAGASGGAVVAVSPTGRARTLMRFDDGPDPIAAIPRESRSTGAAAAGLYVTNDISPYVYFAAASQFTRYAGDVIVGTEFKAQFWILEPRGAGFKAIRLRHNLRGGKYSLEGAIFVG
jgi:hypothetical protein